MTSLLNNIPFPNPLDRRQLPVAVQVLMGCKVRSEGNGGTVERLPMTEELPSREGFGANFFGRVSWASAGLGFVKMNGCVGL